jgi:dipeptide/tripeptide permease
MSSSSAGAQPGFLENFTQLLKQPRALWIVIGAFVVEAMAYFGILTVMASYFSSDLGWGDVKAGMAVSFFTMSVTLFMLGVGSWAEGFGLRRAIIMALVISSVGRIVYSLAPGFSPALTAVSVLASLFAVAIGTAILQPICYSGVKQYTDEKTNSMGYALIYALMNLGIVGMASLSSWIRPAVQDLKDGRATEAPGAIVAFFARISNTGIQAVNWVGVAITLITLLGVLVFFTRKAEAQKVRADVRSTVADARPLGQRLRGYFLEGPFTNGRFIFFIFMLLPVRTLFAHQWLTMPQYIMRAYDKDVADHMEWLVNWINPGIIFIGVPIITALTKRVHVYTMMMIGTLVSAVPTFLLCGGPSLSMLITYFVIFSIGEALWSARFLEYASELAPAGQVSQYMGLANIPWLLAKGTTGIYSGYLLSKYCAEGLPIEQTQTGTLWLIYGCIAMMSPIGLWLARGWVMKGLHKSGT